MSRFYARIKGQARTEATRRGSRISGVQGHICGWNCGVKVIVRDVNGKDYFEVYRTTGSNGGSNPVLIANFTED